MQPRDNDSGFITGPIGTLITSVTISSGSDFSSATLTNGFLNMIVSFRVMCTGNSMDPNCSICREGFQNPASGCTETCTPAQGCCKCVESRLQLLPVLMFFITFHFPQLSLVASAMHLIYVSVEMTTLGRTVTLVG